MAQVRTPDVDCAKGRPFAIRQQAGARHAGQQVIENPKWFNGSETNKGKNPTTPLGPQLRASSETLVRAELRTKEPRNTWTQRPRPRT
jgi:hypothetical protein